MGPVDLFKHALDHTSSVMATVQPHCFDDSTPCDNWNMRQLINHVLYELSWVPELLEGKTVAEVGDKYGGDLIKDNLKANWQSAAERAHKAIDVVKAGSITHLSYGDMPVEHYVTEIGTDLLIHSWDIGQGMHSTVLLDGGIVRLLYDDVLPRADTFETSGIYGKQVTTKPDANLQIKLLAIFGRPSEKWSKLLSA